jgi:hypothetical protein
MRAIVVRIESHLYPPPGVENAGAGIIGLGFGLVKRSSAKKHYVWGVPCFPQTHFRGILT